jgi:hypothetical protein
MGLCWSHQQRKCSICGHTSYGDELCSKCQFEDDIIRWQEAAMRVIDPDDREADLKLRREKLFRAKYHAHKAVEIFFRGLTLSAEALWGELAEPGQEPPHPFSEEKQKTFPFEASA